MLKLRLVVFFVAISLISARAQTTKTQVWSSFQFSATPIKKLKLSTELGNKLYFSPYGYDKCFAQTALEYKLLKKLEVGAGYRFTSRKSDELTESFNRWFIAAESSTKVRRLKTYYRFKYQQEFVSINKSEQVDALNSIQKVRNRVRFKYNIKGLPINPVFSAETFHQKGDMGFKLQQYRIKAGAGFNWTKHHGSSIFYCFEKNYEKPYERIIRAIGIEYSFGL